MKEARPAFYALEPGGWRDIVTLLHPPYTLLHLSFVALGAAFAPEVRWERLAATLLAFFLAVGVAAHLLDEMKGRPLHSVLPEPVLKLGAALSLGGACVIGLLGLLEVSPVLLVFMAVGAFAVVAYNLELFSGVFHGDFQFGLFWGAFPFLTANWVMDESINGVSLLGAAGCFGITMVQRSLSNPVRRLRRHAKTVEGHVEYDDGSGHEVNRSYLLAASERALRYLSLSVPLLACAALLLRALE